MTLSNVQSQIDFIYNALVLTGSIFALETMSQRLPRSIYVKWYRPPAPGCKAAVFMDSERRWRQRDASEVGSQKKKRHPERRKERSIDPVLSEAAGSVSGPWMEVSGTLACCLLIWCIFNKLAHLSSLM